MDIVVDKYLNSLFQESQINLLQEFNFKDIKDKLLNSYEKNVVTMHKMLRDHGINTNKIKKQAFKLSHQIKTDVRNRKDPKVELQQLKK